MVIVDTALKERERAGNPIRVAMVGAGTTGRSVALQLLTPVPGIRLVAIANRTVERAVSAFLEAGAEPPLQVGDPGTLDLAIQAGRAAVTDQAEVVCDAACVDVLVEVTGTVDPAARATVRAIEGGKHVVLVNAELDSTLGPVLKARADKAGVVLTNTDGDEPGVAMTLLRYLASVGMRPVAAGNLKGMVDHYRTPETQAEFARRHGQDAFKVTSFADATKLSMEATLLANASGFGVGRRGMHGPSCEHINEIASLLPAEEMLAGGIVDYALGAAPHTGAFVVVHEESPRKRGHLEYYKLGKGPFYVFYTPYHLPHIQIASTIGRAALFGDATVAPRGGPVCEVLTVAKKDLEPGELLDGVGGFCAYGLIDNAESAREVRALPMGLSEGARLVARVPRDQVVTYGDVELPAGRFSDTLRQEQERRFSGVTA